MHPSVLSGVSTSGWAGTWAVDLMQEGSHRISGPPGLESLPSNWLGPEYRDGVFIAQSTISSLFLKGFVGWSKINQAHGVLAPHGVLVLPQKRWFLPDRRARPAVRIPKLWERDLSPTN